MKLKLINLKNKKAIIKINKKFFRPTEVNYLRGDPNKARKILKWKHKTSFKELIKMMMMSDLEKYR